MKLKLTNNKILAAIVIAALLCLAYFFGGKAINDDLPVSAENQTISSSADIGEASSLSSPDLPADIDQLVWPTPGAPAIYTLQPTADAPASPAVTAESPVANTPAAHPGAPEDEAPGYEPETSAKTALTCTLSISCSSILNNIDKLTEGKESLIPDDGWLFYGADIVFYDGDTVFDVLKRELQSRTMHLEFMKTPALGTVYIEGICNIYEFDCGELSGWQFKVNGVFSGVGCSLFELSDGDVIEWLYTCDLGQDIGGGQA